VKSRSSRLLGCAVGLLSAAAILFLAPGHRLAQGAKEDLAETVIKGVEHREQLIKNIRSMKAVWRGVRCPADGKGSSARELFLLEGRKERVESVLGRPPKCAKEEVVPQTRASGAPRGPGAGPSSSGGGVTVTTGRMPPGTREITVYDGRTAWAFIPTETGLNRGPSRVSCEPWGIGTNVATWAAIECRFASDQHGPSWIARGCELTAERIPGPPERYKVTVVKSRPERGKCVSWVAPEYGYAVTRVEMEYSGFHGLHPRRYTYEYGQFKELAPGLWLPHRVTLRAHVRRVSGDWRLGQYDSAAAEEMKLNIDIPDHNFRMPGTR